MFVVNLLQNKCYQFSEFEERLAVVFDAGDVAAAAAAVVDEVLVHSHSSLDVQDC